MHTRKKHTSQILIRGLIGYCGDRKVFVGFAPANLLYSLSFVDLLNEHTGQGYQRKFNQQHSVDFRKYIRKPRSTTIPLTLNLRPESKDLWGIAERSGASTLKIVPGSSRILSQVDCQHRLGSLADLDIPLAFMTFIGLTLDEEMEVFNVINSKARGLNASLLDFHQSKLCEDLGTQEPELYLALRLHDDEDSVWYRQLELGGTRVIGMARRASLRTMKNAVKRFLRQRAGTTRDVEHTYNIISSFWRAVALLLKYEWANSRKHFLTKGIGVYALMDLAAELHNEAVQSGAVCNEQYFISVLADFIQTFDWSHTGPLKGLGGEIGADKAYSLLRQHRKATVNHGK